MLKEFGQDLKSIRESKNITIAEISAQTRINPKFINYIESGVFDFQPDTYMRAFLREYARCINVSESVLLNDYEKAKSGFYVRKGPKKEETAPSAVKLVVEKVEKRVKPPEQPAVVLKPKVQPEQPVRPSQFTSNEDDKNGSANAGRNWTQKVLLGLLIAVIIVSVIYMLNYLNNSSNDQNQVKPKSFEEIEGDYKTKIKGKTGKDTLTAKSDSLKPVTADSLKLTIVAGKDVRIKVYLDESQVVEDIIPAKDSMTITAKEQFRFSASANSSIDLYLNGKYLRKPASLTGSTIKNLVIQKDGIVTE